MTRMLMAIGLLTLASELGPAHAEDPEPAATQRLTIRAWTSDGAPAAHASLRVEVVSTPSGRERSLERKINERLHGTSDGLTDDDGPDVLDSQGEAVIEALEHRRLRIEVATPSEFAEALVDVDAREPRVVALELRRDAIVELNFGKNARVLPSCAFRIEGSSQWREFDAYEDGSIVVRGLSAGAVIRPQQPARIKPPWDIDSYFRVEPDCIVAGEIGTVTTVDASVRVAPLATIRGRVVDDADNPVSARVESLNVHVGGGVDVVREVRCADGAFSIGVIPGAMLRVRAALHEEAIVFTEPGSSTVGVVRLTRLAIEDVHARGGVRGVVRRDEDGQPIVGATVRSTRIATGEVREYARTDVRGRFHLNPIPAGDLVLEVDTDDGVASKRIHLGDRDVVEVDLRVAPSDYVEISAIDAETRQPIERVVAVVDGRAMPRTAFVLSWVTPTPFEFRAPGYEPLARSLNAADAANHRIVVELRRLER